MNKEQEHLDKLTLTRNKIHQMNKKTDRVIAKAQKYADVLEKLDEKDDIISIFRWLIAHKKRQKAMVNARALLDASSIQLTQWAMLIDDYKKFF